MFKTFFTTAQQTTPQVGSCAQGTSAAQVRPVELSSELLRQVGGGAPVSVNSPKHGW